MALGYLACDTVNQIGGAEHSAATKGDLLCKAEINIVILLVSLVVVSPLVCDEEWNSWYQLTKFWNKSLCFLHLNDKMWNRTFISKLLLISSIP